LARDPMDRACELAERGRYTAAPNPLVGAVVVSDGRIVGEGFHARTGEDHAEVVALGQCGAEARGATLYVTLEPCNHHGRTPPCTQAILDAGVSRVVVGCLDPDPRMRGRSVNLMRDAGVEVEVIGDSAQTAAFARQNEQFFHYMTTGRPFVYVKLAMTLDGRISSGGSREKITGDEARSRVHLLRAEAGAVLVGAGTARADDPLLDARHLPQDVQPPAITRVVLDPTLSLDPESSLACDAFRKPVLVFGGEEAFDGREGVLKEAGVEAIPAPALGGELDLGFVLDELGRRGLRGLLVEGGGETVGSFARAGFIDKMTLFYAPRLIGAGGVPAVGALKNPDGFAAPGASGFEVENVERVGEDVALTVYPAGSVETAERKGA
jgi:diaminohydroxyphosphoribosylaminopyrimidine deaminase / 5-amino-6-(5-phosphoribosylamino)uracil reductase